MSEIKVGSTVEYINSESALTVKMVTPTQVVVQSETMKLEVYPPEDLYVVPGTDYCRLRRTVIDTMDKITKEIGRNNMNSTRYQLALSRALYAEGVRRGEEDLVEHVKNSIQLTIKGCVSSEAVLDMIRANRHRVRDVGNGHPLFTPIAGTEADFPPIAEMEPVPVKPGEDPMVLQHTDLTGHSETLVQQLNDDDLAMMCCEIADMLANGMGFTADMKHRKMSQRESDMSLLQRRVTYWSEPRGNVRKTQVWEMAKKVVGHCRMAEIEDAIENVLEAIRQQEEPDEE